jgi:hypothetical protein
LFWCFCVLLCRELFRGDHIISPWESQLLGLVNEVAGGGRVESYREWRVRSIAEKKSEATEKSGDNQHVE